jgi:hypothetical protein
MAGIPSSESQLRKLIYFPIVHDQADMGALRDTVKSAVLKKLGRQGWKRRVNIIDEFWDQVERTIDDLSLPLERVRVYQDGLPVSGKESDIVRELAKSGSRNHALVLRLMDGTAKVMGTESLELLLEEYELVKRSLSPDGAQRRGKISKDLSASLLERRDKFIAARINNTLRVGEVGLLFLGMLHWLEPWLDPDIEVTFPLFRPIGHPTGAEVKGP